MSVPSAGPSARPSPPRSVEGRGRAEAPRPEAPDGPLALLAMAAWFGSVTGLLEVGVLLAWRQFNNAAVLGVFQLNRHFLWAIPATHLAVFLACGLPLALTARFCPRPARRGGTFLLCALAIFSLLKMMPGLHAAAAGALATGFAYRAASRIEAGARLFRRLIRTSLPVALGLAMALGGLTYYRVVLSEGRALAALPSPAAGAPNVLLIVLDTVRADRLSVYGYERDTTPHLARLARRGIVFGQARSAAPWTLPSHASLFTGRWPHELRVATDRPLDASYPTLAEFLTSNGYATAGFVGNTYFCNSWYGLARGFARYEDSDERNILISPGEALRCTALGRWLIRLAGIASNARPEVANTPKDAERVNHDFLSWHSGHRGRPFFAFLNYIDAHDPYLTPPGFDRHFGLRPGSPADVETLRNLHHRRKTDLSGRDITLIRDAYDDCLAYLDEQLGRLFDELDRRGVLRDTLVIVTSDHGEELGERGLYGHGKRLYKEEVHVPLIVVGPTGVPAGRSIPDPVSLRDVAATVADRLGLAGESPFPGRSLARFWEPSPQGSANRSDDPILSELSIQATIPKEPNLDLPPALLGPMASLVSEGMVYIRDAIGREELYDLASDPDEAHNLARSKSAKAQATLERSRIALDRLVRGDKTRR